MSTNAKDTTARETPSALEALGEPLKRQRFADEISDRLAKAIRNGDLEPGTRLVEARLARELGVSRAPVREALRHLERSGLATAEKGLYWVPSLDVEDLRELVLLRIALERLAIALAAEQASDEDIDALAQVVARMHELEETQPSNTRALLELDAGLHSSLCKLSGNRRLQALWTAMDDQIRLAIVTANISFPEPRGVADDHQLIIDALRTRDRDRCERAIESHIRRGLLNIEALPDG